MQSKFISYSKRQAQPCEGRREIKTKNNGLSDDAQQWQEYQLVRTAKEHILNHYYKILSTNFFPGYREERTELLILGRHPGQELN